MAARDVLFAIYQASYRDTYPLFTAANAREPREWRGTARRRDGCNNGAPRAERRKLRLSGGPM